jgi:hypothetical protein
MSHKIDGISKARHRKDACMRKNLHGEGYKIGGQFEDKTPL